MQPERAIEDAAAITVGSQRRDRVIPILVTDDFFGRRREERKEDEASSCPFLEREKLLVNGRARDGLTTVPSVARCYGKEKAPRGVSKKKKARRFSNDPDAAAGARPERPINELCSRGS